MDFLFAPESPLFDFLEPFDLLKMLHLTRSARRGAVPKLKKFQASAETAKQGLMFEQWLENPNVGPMDETMKRSNTRNKLTGPLRLGSIQQRIDTLRENFIVLSYERKSYTQETSCVAVFDDEGAFVAYYTMTSSQFYEPYCDRNIVEAQDIQGVPDIWIESSAGFHVGDRSDERWKMQYQDLHWEDKFFMGDVTFSNYVLFKLFHGILSPTEVATVLMHALSSDTRVIYWYVFTLFNSMNNEFEYMEGDTQEEVNALEAWHRSLPGV